MDICGVCSKRQVEVVLSGTVCPRQQKVYEKSGLAGRDLWLYLRHATTFHDIYDSLFFFFEQFYDSFISWERFMATFDILQPSTIDIYDSFIIHRHVLFIID